MIEAVTFIRDGVLVDRMAENACAFALAVSSNRKAGVAETLSAEDLINWAFEQSGLSAREKMRLLNADRGEVVGDLDAAAARYTQLAESAAVDYFPEALELLEALHNRRVLSFITSAVRQEVLDVWGQSAQGQRVNPYLELLGDGEKGQKGEGHFEYVRRQGATRVFAVADAVSEIRAAAEFADFAIGFAHVISPDRVQQAWNLFGHDQRLDLDRLVLPEKGPLEAALRVAGANEIITGSRDTIMAQLKSYFRTAGLL